VATSDSEGFSNILKTGNTFNKREMSIDIPEATNEEEQHTESIYENNPLLEIYEKNKGKVQKPQVIERPNSTLSSPKTIILDGISESGADYSLI
jgi:hypothetical protein